MTTHLPYDICLRLRDAGLPQPEKETGQNWYLPTSQHLIHICKNTLREDLICYFSESDFQSGSMSRTEKPQRWLIFCPDAEYLLDYLPPGYVIQKHKGHHHFGDQYAVFNLSSPFIAEAAPTAARAAADVYLAINEKVPTP